MHLLCTNSPEGGPHYPTTFTAATDGSGAPLPRLPIFCRNPVATYLQQQQQQQNPDYPPSPDYNFAAMFPQPRTDLISLGLGGSPTKFHHSMPPSAIAAAAAFFPPIVAVGTWHPHNYRPRAKRPTPFCITDILGHWEAVEKLHRQNAAAVAENGKCLDGHTAFTKINHGDDSDKIINRLSGLQDLHHHHQTHIDDLVSSGSEADTGHCGGAGDDSRGADSDCKDSGGMYM